MELRRAQDGGRSPLAASITGTLSRRGVLTTRGGAFAVSFGPTYTGPHGILLSKVYAKLAGEAYSGVAQVGATVVTLDHRTPLAKLARDRNHQPWKLPG